MSNIPPNLIDSLISCPSANRITQVANMQNYIQGILGPTHHTFLQGSYKNDTALSDINDVDIVAMRLITFSGTFSPHAQNRPIILWDQIFSEIEKKLRGQSRYSWTVEPGDKCLKVRGSFNADVVPAVQVGRDQALDPIVIFSFRDSMEKLNYPRLHYENGIKKNHATEGLYKPMVRMFKNWAANHFGGNKGIISSFKMEALVYEADNDLFNTDKALSFIKIGYAILKKLKARHLLPIVLPSVCGKEDISASWGLFERGTFINQLAESLNYAADAYIATTQINAEDKWRKTFNI